MVLDEDRRSFSMHWPKAGSTNHGVMSAFGQFGFSFPKGHATFQTLKKIVTDSHSSHLMMPGHL